MKSKFALLSNLRLGSGIILMVFAATHLINHALGLISLDAMAAGREIFLAFWRHGIGQILIFAALIVHVALTLFSLYRRQTLRGIRKAEILQLVAGLAIPALLVEHVIGTRILHERYGLEDSYTWTLLSLWVWQPFAGIRQTAALLLVWIHGCLGLHFWLLLKPWYRRAIPYLYSIALLLPILSLLGFVDGGRAVEAMWQDETFRQTFMDNLNLPDGAIDWAYGIRDTVYWVMLAVLGILFTARAVQYWRQHKRDVVRITYPDGRQVAVSPGASVLDASRQADIPHASVCGGRGRCSTCRIRILDGAETLPAPSQEEERVLRRVAAPDGVRLACQLVPDSDLSVVPLLPASAEPKDGFQRKSYLQGSEREIAVLFADLRSFTQFSEKKLPFDVVFVINQYFRYMGTAVEQSNGHLDKFIGDGVMALFGLDNGPVEGSRDALRAARAMANALDDLNRALHTDLPSPFKIGIGIHIGHVIVGEMGYAAATSITAIGDAVNTASRLESANKDFQSQLIVSQDVVDRAGIDLSSFRTDKIEIRGRDQPLNVHILENATQLPVLPMAIS